jgi:hypothetical protein
LPDQVASSDVPSNPGIAQQFDGKGSRCEENQEQSENQICGRGKQHPKPTIRDLSLIVPIRGGLR